MRRLFQERKIRMKSAYELAMERLQQTSPSLSLTEEQKKELAELDSKYQAKIAEKELFLNEQIRKAQAEGKVEEVESLEKQLPQRSGGYGASAKRAKKNCAPALRNCSRVSVRRAPHVMQTACVTSHSEAATTIISPAKQRPRAQARGRAHRVSVNQDRESRACARA